MFYHFEYDSCYIKKTKLYAQGVIDVKQNGVTLLVGKNGTGKTTLLKRLYQQIEEKGIYISQENYEILKGFTVLENLTLFQSGISEDRVMDILKRYQLEHILEKKADTMSGGEKRIVSILRGILSEEELIFLDEPTNDLDYHTVEIIVQLLAEFKSVKTFLVVTHDERLYPIMDCMYEIKEKQIVNVKVNSHMGEPCFIPEERAKKDLSNPHFRRKLFHLDYCGILCLAVMLVFSVYMFISTKHNMNQKIERLEEGQIRICNSLYGSPKDLAMDGYIPTSLIAYMNSRISFDELSKILEKCVKDSEEKFYCLDLNIEETKDYSVFRMKQMDMNTSEEYDTLDYCKLENGQMITKEEYEKAMKVIQAASEGKLENTLLVLHFQNGYDFYHFIKEEQYQERWKGNYYICSNETIELVEQARNIARCKENLKFWTTAMLVLGFVILYGTWLNWHMIKKKLRILANYGFDRNEIQKLLLSRYSSSILYLGALVSGEAIMAGVYLYYGGTDGTKDYVFMVLYAGLVLGIWMLQRKIYKCSMKRIYQMKGEL